MGIADSLIRVSVGIEDCGDLIGDFTQALAMARTLGRGLSRAPHRHHKPRKLLPQRPQSPLQIARAPALVVAFEG
jgi:hypothetical protein